MQWLWFSLIASVALTVVVNLAVRLWPGGAERGARRVDDWVRHQVPADDPLDERHVRVIVPWKAMLLVSIVATVLLNVVLRLW